jgi:hypothetical protein
MIQVCLRPMMASCSLNEDFAELRLFMKKTAPNTAILSGSSHISPAFCR